MADQKVVGMSDENLVSLFKLAKRWLVVWKIDLKKLLNVSRQIRKEDLLGLINGTHEIVPKKQFMLNNLVKGFEKKAKLRKISLRQSYLTCTGILKDIPYPEGCWGYLDKPTTVDVIARTAQKVSEEEAVRCFTEELERGTFDEGIFTRNIFIGNKNNQNKYPILVCERNHDGKVGINKEWCYFNDIIVHDADSAWWTKV